jgi:acetoin utilization deacetylase AcuC-like enzyme
MNDALKEGIAGNLAGGTHHSHADRGEGYCVFDEGVFIFSMHGEKNYPFVTIPSHLDIALPDGTEDEAYLEHLSDGLIEIKRFDPDYIFYQMGVDPLKEDTLGKLHLTFDGLMKRDELVLSYARRAGIPVSLALGGGYAKPIDLSVRAYANTYRVAMRVFAGTRRL